jgi:hypothetical protein
MKLKCVLKETGSNISTFGVLLAFAVILAAIDLLISNWLCKTFIGESSPYYSYGLFVSVLVIALLIGSVGFAVGTCYLNDKKKEGKVP